MTTSVDVVLVRGSQAASLAERLRVEYPKVQVVSAADLDVDPARITIVAGNVRDDELPVFSSLEWVHSWAAGVESEVGPRLRSSGIPITSSAGNGAVPLAEHAMMLALMLNRKAVRWIDSQRDRRWERFVHSELAGQTMGIYGFGNVGRELALRARAFGMRVIALRRRPDMDADLVDRMFGPDQLHSFAAACDVLVVAAALTPDSEGAIDSSVLVKLPDGAHVIVISRGNIVRDSDLLDALRSGKVAAAGLDAHAVEPLPSDSPYWTLPGVIITPHNGATTAATATRGVEIFLDNLRRRSSNRPYRNRVDVSALA
ncbi:D-2-hydroxyacid dehydrogenase [Arthrobacter sp. JZ12]|uniref:D-2-hydroxyacid dehydrogenase n=1 Tax=Arthrobacter sp. JZ12 TaxID=2654190 RepID=UPI002B462BBC|nr:D-2-hydroxyacid dehydrogenase [Arthrobacter sp. JZ12]WRH24248.1 D-2-hydroxyacid dehydrogenase [Arthrobacter sp. JZ12]